MKNILTFLILVTFSIFALSIFSYAQIENYEFKPRGKKVFVPFELHNNLIVIKVNINKSDTLNFILDTGASTTIITDPNIVSLIDIKFEKEVKLGGFGKRGEMLAWVSSDNQICLPGIVASHQHVMAVQESFLDFSSHVGMPIHGLLGYEIFKNFVVTIDFKSQLICFRNPINFIPTSKYGEKIPITIYKGKPHIKGKIQTAEGRIFLSNLLLDTGAGNSLMLNWSYTNPAYIPNKDKLKILGSGINGAIWGYEGRLEAIQLGSFSFDHVIASFPDSTSYHYSPLNFQRQGNIGCELLRRFKVTFYYAQNYIFLKPYRNSFKEAFERDMSGLTIRAKGKKFNTFYVENVENESPAFYAGIQQGDEVFAIQKQLVSTLKMSEISEMLSKNIGKKINIILRREGKFIQTKFKLKKLV